MNAYMEKFHGKKINMDNMEDGKIYFHVSLNITSKGDVSCNGSTKLKI